MLTTQQIASEYGGSRHVTAPVAPYVIKSAAGDFYAEGCLSRRSAEYPDATTFSRESHAVMTARKLTCGQSLFGTTCEVWCDYGTASATLIGTADNGSFYR